MIPNPRPAAAAHEPDRLAARLVARAGEGDTGVEVREHHGVRWLQFGAGAIQSLMHLREPDALVLPYTRALTCWLLFREPPRRVLMLGLGGGSLLRWLLAECPAAVIEAVEHDARVSELARTWFRVPPDGPRLRVLIDDARDALAGLDGGRDLVLLDVFDATGMPGWLAEPRVYELAAARLAPGGVLCANLWARDRDEFLRLLRALRHAFDGRTLCLPVEGYHNVAVLAFEGPPETLDLAVLGRRAAVLEARYRVEMPRFVAAMAAANLVHEGCLVL